MAFICLFHINSSSIDSPTIANVKKTKSISLASFFFLLLPCVWFSIRRTIRSRCSRFEYRIWQTVTNNELAPNRGKIKMDFYTDPAKKSLFYRLNVSTNGFPYFSANFTEIIHMQMVFLMFSCDTQVSMYWNCALSFTLSHACFNLISYRRLNLPKNLNNGRFTHIKRLNSLQVTIYFRLIENGGFSTKLLLSFVFGFK